MATKCNRRQSGSIDPDIFAFACVYTLCWRSFRMDVLWRCAGHLAARTALGRSAPGDTATNLLSSCARVGMFKYWSPLVMRARWDVQVLDRSYRPQEEALRLRVVGHYCYLGSQSYLTRARRGVNIS